MTMDGQRIVIAYFGEPIPDKNVADIMSVIEKSGVTSGNKKAAISLMTAKEAEELLISGLAIKKASLNVKVPAKIVENPVDKALTYIGMRFADTLVGPDRNIVSFTLALITAVANARQNQCDKELITAVEILCNNVINTDSTLCVKYGITPTIIAAINQVHNTEINPLDYVFGC